jgi:hypothetical protein
MFSAAVAGNGKKTSPTFRCRAFDGVAAATIARVVQANNSLSMAISPKVYSHGVRTRSECKLIAIQINRVKVAHTVGVILRCAAGHDLAPSLRALAKQSRKQQARTGLLRRKSSSQ